MSDCCSANKPKPSKCECPENGSMYLEVSKETILHHLDRPWRHKLKEQKYFFCHDPECEVVYFTEDCSVIRKSQLRTRVGIKEQDDSALTCYCFGVSNLEARTVKEAKAFVIQQTKESACSCATSNPSGRCCLKDFPKNKK